MPIFKHTSKMLNKLRNKISEDDNSEQEIGGDDHVPYSYEVSVVTPSYKGENHIIRVLNSIKNQTLPYDLFEVIIIINGELDGTKELVETFNLNNPELNLRIFYSKLASASNARNIGIQTAKGRYITFVDDDDYVSPNYLDELYKNAASNRIVMARMEDVDEANSICPCDPNKEIDDGIIKDPYTNINRYFSFNACKLIPSNQLKKIMFDVKLTSGEDIVFFADLISSNDFEVYVVKKESTAIYYRVLRSDSVSRKPISYKFNVEDRLTVIEKLNKNLTETDNSDHINGIKIRINAQTTFINKYLKEYPNEYNRVVESIKELNLEYFNMKELNKNLAKRLVISFSFLPFKDISAYSIGKRIFNDGNIVDIVHNNMNPLRKVDENSSKLTEGYLGSDRIINSVPTFGNWKHIQKFSKLGIEIIGKLTKENGGYKEIYSYSMYPASNFLAFNYKIEHPEVKWIVEFSDQLIYNTIGDVINATIPDTETLTKINDLLNENGFPEDSTGRIFFLNEYLAYAFADELIFPTENQKEYMLDKFPYKEILGSIQDKTKIIAPSILECKFYSLIHQDYKLNDDIVNFAYFDSLYEGINLEQVYIATETLKESFKDKFMIHIFTKNPDRFKDSVTGLVNDGLLKINPAVNFLEFLNLTTKFDCLIVTDQKTKKTKQLNPFMPFRLADYIGSGTDIWGICEEGSAMSFQDIKYKSNMYDPISNQEILLKIIEDHLRRKF